ncbi:MAG: hypothetical protein ACRC8A_15465 [Microcoleaceae cyanobacterium]
MTEPKPEQLTRTLNQLIEEHGVTAVIQELSVHCLKEAQFLKTDGSLELATYWHSLGERLHNVLSQWQNPTN